MNADAVAALASALYETDPPELWMRTSTTAYRERATAILEIMEREHAALAAAPLPSEPCPGCGICVGEIDDCGCVIGHEHTCAPLPSDTPADELDEEREISLVGAEELGHAVAETPWPPVESDAIGETVTGHGAVLLARLHRRGWALVPLAATLDHREQPYGTQEYPKADTMHEELES